MSIIMVYVRCCWPFLFLPVLFLPPRAPRLRRSRRGLNSFDRPNLHFSVGRATNQIARLRETAALLRRHPETAIVYVPTRNHTDGVAAVLRRWGFRAAPYHAGLPSKARTELLEQFLDGRVRVMVATNAFGMGIENPNVAVTRCGVIPCKPGVDNGVDSALNRFMVHRAPARRLPTLIETLCRCALKPCSCLVQHQRTVWQDR